MNCLVDFCVSCFKGWAHIEPGTLNVFLTFDSMGAAVKNVKVPPISSKLGNYSIQLRFSDLASLSHNDFRIT